MECKKMRMLVPMYRDAHSYELFFCEFKTSNNESLHLHYLLFCPYDENCQKDKKDAKDL
jgi:hypothetical protein